jgi:hypothetical protein
MKNEIGLCPICDRIMIEGSSVNAHHFDPKCKGGKETEYLHRACHQKIHSLFTESELHQKYNNAEVVKEHPEMQKFIRWISKKEPTFYTRSKKHGK